MKQNSYLEKAFAMATNCPFPLLKESSIDFPPQLGDIAVLEMIKLQGENVLLKVL